MSKDTHQTSFIGGYMTPSGARHGVLRQGSSTLEIGTVFIW